MKHLYLNQSLLACFLMATAMPLCAEGKTSEEGVDLGLSVIWSTKLLDTETPSSYSKEHVWGSPFSRVSYTDKGEYAPEDMNIGLSIASTNYDPATAIWGDGWRMPTKEEVEELLALGVTNHIENSRVVGYKITGTNGNSVIYRELSSLNLKFWTASAYRANESDTDFSKAWLCEIGLVDRKISAVKRSEPYFILPVRDKATTPKEPVTSISLSEEDLILPLGEKSTLYPFVGPDNATLRRVTYSSSAEDVVSVDEYGHIEALKDGSAVITATATDGSGCKGTCTVKVPSMSESAEVDLGLSVLWAAYNVGAQTISDKGTYFMFATPQTVTKWSVTMTPYKPSYVLPVDNVAGTQYDPATVNMGEGWMTPTKEQMQELFDNCTSTEIDGGFELTSKINGVKLFFPLTGFKNVSATNYGENVYLQTAKTEDKDVVHGTYPCGVLKKNGVMTFEERKLTQGVVVRAVKAKPDESGIGSVITDDESDSPVDVYNMCGVMILHQADRASLYDLPAGLYIVRTPSGKAIKVRI